MGCLNQSSTSLLSHSEAPLTHVYAQGGSLGDTIYMHDALTCARFLAVALHGGRTWLWNLISLDLIP